MQRFVAGDFVSARDFFARARKLVLLRLQEQGSPNLKRRASDTDVNGHSLDYAAGATYKARGVALTDFLASPGKITNAPTKISVEGTWHDAEIATGEFPPDAMRLDRCMAVSICRQGPEAF